MKNSPAITQIELQEPEYAELLAQHRIEFQKYRKLLDLHMRVRKLNPLTEEELEYFKNHIFRFLKEEDYETTRELMDNFETIVRRRMYS